MRKVDFPVEDESRVQLLPQPLSFLQMIVPSRTHVFLKAQRFKQVVSSVGP